MKEYTWYNMDKFPENLSGDMTFLFKDSDNRIYLGTANIAERSGIVAWANA